MVHINNSIPPFVQNQPCPTCNGRGYKQERGGFHMIACPTCKGLRKLPILQPDGRFLKRGQSLSDFEPEIIKRSI